MINFGAAPVVVSEWIECKALRVRAAGVCFRKWLGPIPDTNAAVRNYDTPPLPFSEIVTQNVKNAGMDAILILFYLACERLSATIATIVAC